MKLVVIDTETGGLDPDKHSILELSAVVWEDGEILAQKTTAIGEATLCVTPHAMSLNQIDLRGRCALSPGEAVDGLESFLDEHFTWRNGLTLAGHNTSFDVAFLKRLFRLANEKHWWFSHRLVDTTSLIFAATGETMSLYPALERFGVPVPERLHTSMGDAEATAKLLTKLLQELGRKQ